MKKLRLVVLSFSAFSLFCSVFFNLAYIIYENKYVTYKGDPLNLIKILFASNPIVFIVMFAIVLIWYIYHRKDRAESITNGLVLLMYVAYAVFFVLAILKLYDIWGPNLRGKEPYDYDAAASFSLAILLAPGAWNIIALIPLLSHFIASVSTNGYDNVSEPDNIYAFMYTTIGICYLGTLLLLNFTAHSRIFSAMFALNENGLIMTIMILTFILCAGLRFNSVVLNIFNIVMNFAFIIIWLVILIYNAYETLYVYMSLYHFIFIIPMAVLSIFILIHYIKVDRFYKGRTKNFLHE